MKNLFFKKISVKVKFAYSTLSLIIILFLSLSAHSLPDRKTIRPLFFQADKNNLKILPQKFEYALTDEEKMQLGDITIDASQINFQIVPSNNNYKLRFQWPIALLTEGQIIIKDNSGKAIYAAPVPKSSVHAVKKTKASLDTERNELAESFSDEISKEVIDGMKFTPFLTFCVFREEIKTKIILCSKELYFSSNKNGSTNILPRESEKKLARVEINGKKVENQGQIFLSNKQEEISLRAFLASGATLEINTRMNEVDFKDVVAIENSSEILLTANGAEPVDPKKVKRVNSNWQTRINTSRPSVYLKGEADIPLRQEFTIDGTLPSEKDRIFVDRNSPTKTYNSEILMHAYNSKNNRVSAFSSDSEVITINPEKFDWKIKDLLTNQKNRRYLQIQSKENKFVAGLDVSRGLAYELRMAGQMLFPSSLLNARINFDWWFENFLGIDTNFTHLNWGLGLERLQHLTTKTGETKFDSTVIELKYRFKSGFYLEDETWGLSVPYQIISADGFSTSSMGLGVFTQKSAPKLFKNIMSWYNAKFIYSLASSGADLKIKQAYRVDFLAYQPIGLETNSFIFNYGLGLQTIKFDPAAEKEPLNFDFSVGFSYRF